MSEELNLSIDQITCCQEFLSQSAAKRLTTLKKMGLERYQQLLCQMPATPANEKCLLRFLIYPQQVKFPQLQDADLQGLNLQGMNLIRVKFNNAQLQECDLLTADLIFGDFTGADLHLANLSGCTLNESQWTNTIVTRCDFRRAVGLTPQQRLWLHQEGAILD